MCEDQPEKIILGGNHIGKAMTRKSYKCSGHKGQVKSGVLSKGYNLEIILNAMGIYQRQHECDIQFLVEKIAIHCIVYPSVCPIQTCRKPGFCSSPEPTTVAVLYQSLQE